jgi:hypothetical protein
MILEYNITPSAFPHLADPFSRALCRNFDIFNKYNSRANIFNPLMTHFIITHIITYIINFNLHVIVFLIVF